MAGAFAVLGACAVFSPPGSLDTDESDDTDAAEGTDASDTEETDSDVDLPCEGPYGRPVDATCMDVTLYVRLPEATCFRRLPVSVAAAHWSEWPAVPCDEGLSLASNLDIRGGCYFFPRNCQAHIDDPWFRSCEEVPCDCLPYHFEQQGLCEGEEAFDTDEVITWPYGQSTGP